MLRALRNLFSKPTPPQALSPALEVDTFAQQLGDLSVFVIGAIESEGIDASALTQENLLANIREALERDREHKASGYALFVFVAEGKRRLPFFTSNEQAERFCGEHSKALNRVFPFMLLQVKASILGTVPPSSCDVVVMNDKSPDQHVLTDVEMAAVRRMWG